MMPEWVEQFQSGFDEAFILIGLAILGIEIAKGVFTRTLTGRGALDMLANISTQIPYLLVEVFLLSSLYVAYQVVADNFIGWTMPVTVGTALLAVLAADFTYYWEHRFNHTMRLFWTQHAVHHSSRHFNITTSIRFGPFEGLMSALMHFPLILIGFPPELVIFGIVVVLAYQTWIHTELIGKLGPLEFLINTPANHRVHHGCDEKYLDKNFAGILMIWDQLFGSFQKEEETPRYGLKRDYDSENPLSVWFSELPAFSKDLGKANSIGDVFGYLFRPPGWAPKPKETSSKHPAE